MTVIISRRGNISGEAVVEEMVAWCQKDAGRQGRRHGRRSSPSRFDAVEGYEGCNSFTVILRVENTLLSRTRGNHKIIHTYALWRLARMAVPSLPRYLLCSDLRLADENAADATRLI